MALLVRVLRKQTSISQWVPICSQLMSVSSTQSQRSKTLSSTSQWLQKNPSGMCVGSEQIVGMDTPHSRKYHNTSKQSWDTMRGSFQMITAWLLLSGELSSIKNVKTLGSLNCWWSM
ncbi:rCG37273, isoform CRA_c [Rattus norvegicus]|uniref:RCG37273, isoform CRA_c n=1 Tax=Rattus norvegicus TaxID=10116 RepID=A6KI70_RAT|nr:rCG37273, isoform CRA_c [Rattus norvegicus]